MAVTEGAEETSAVPISSIPSRDFIQLPFRCCLPFLLPPHPTMPPSNAISCQSWASPLSSSLVLSVNTSSRAWG